MVSGSGEGQAYGNDTSVTPVTLLLELAIDVDLHIGYGPSDKTAEKKVLQFDFLNYRGFYQQLAGSCKIITRFTV